MYIRNLKFFCGEFVIKKAFGAVSKMGTNSLGYGRSQFKKFLQKAGQLERKDLEKGLEN